MRKITVMAVMMFFLAIVTGCATSGDFKALNKQFRKIALGVEECQQFIQVDFDQALKEQGERIDTLAQAKLLAPVPPLAPVPINVAKDARIEPELPIEPKPPASPLPPVKPVKAEIAESLEARLAKLTKRVDGHDRKFRILSDLQRRIAEVEDETKPLYLWTQSFVTRSSKLSSKNEKKLDGLALELLKGTLKVEKEVKGHADPRGKQKDNEELSKERAQSCIDHLLKKLGADSDVPWEAGTTWKKYFVAMAGGETDRYGNYKHNRRVRFQKKR